LGDGAALRHVAALARLDLVAASRSAHELLHSDLLLRDDPVEFFHPVVRSAIYDGLDAVARSQGHRRAAEILAEAGAPLERVAAHIMLTTGDTDEFAVD